MTLLMLLFDFVQQVAMPCCLLFVTFIVQLVFWIRIARKLKPGISQVPGPRLARWSRLWIARALATGRSHEIWTEVNEKFGSVARIGPNHLITHDPDIIRRILTVRSGYVRGPWFDSVRIDPHIPNVVSERDVKKHGKIRAKLAPSFTGSCVATMEPAMDKLLGDWLDTLRKRFGEPDQVICDIGQKIQFLTADIITKICLGGEIGCVESDCDMHGIIKTVKTGSMACQYFSVFLELNTLFFQLARIPALRRMLYPGPCDSTGVGRLMGVVHEVVEKRVQEGNKTNDVIGSLLERGMSKEQIDSELIITLVAGSDTTSTAVQSTLLCIVTTPHVYNTLRAEIHEAVVKGHVSNPIQYSEAKLLAYLQACVFEGLRKFPPLAQLRERVVPPEGDTLGPFRVPGGTFVGLNAWGAQFNKAVYGDDASLYNPDRWLTDDANKLQAMYQTHSLIFGYGSTKCLGTMMAMMEITKVIFELLRNFEISIANPHKPWDSQCFGIFVQRNFKVRLRQIDNTQPPTYDHAVNSVHS
ncbi:hypothetical protein QQS21_009300 [Conoideocrella luteorostrata]|uniref:Cytochrome P450 n=1 Tax=Conoideocrella luteorostrata TaxID=1105319 RepID=A0AAJ0FXX4_9HYPO|nr:hypothetical protein QQS21_009300 [Conoideocrella luteorostrata]